MAASRHDATADPLCDALTRPIPGTGPLDPEAVDEGPQWQQLVMLAPPGIDALVAAASPPLQIISAILSVIAALLEVLAAILIGLPDLYKALIMAAYSALKAIIQDIIDAGFYFYFDAGGVTSLEDIANQMGIPTAPVSTFKAGMQGAPPPPAPPDRFVTWGQRFVASFDDPGDQNRPVFSDVASVAAVFIVAAAPSFDALKQLLFLLGQLFNIQPFAALDWKPGSPDPDLSRARGKPQAPDWESLKLKDIFPPIQGLMAIPEALKGLLVGGEGLTGLIAGLVLAIKAKVKTLQDIIAVLQSILDLLEALKSTGLWALPVMTSGGVTGLKQAFLTAQNRPPGGFVAGVCVLAAGPGIPSASTLFTMLGQSGALQSLEAALDVEINQVGAAVDQLNETSSEAAAELDAAVGASSSSSADQKASARQNPSEAAKDAANSKDPKVAAAAKKVVAHSDYARKRGPRSLTFGLGLGPENPEPGPLDPESKPLKDPDDDCGDGA